MDSVSIFFNKTYFRIKLFYSLILTLYKVLVVVRRCLNSLYLCNSRNLQIIFSSLLHIFSRLKHNNFMKNKRRSAVSFSIVLNVVLSVFSLGCLSLAIMQVYFNTNESIPLTVEPIVLTANLNKESSYFLLVTDITKPLNNDVYISIPNDCENCAIRVKMQNVAESNSGISPNMDDWIKGNDNYYYYDKVINSNDKIKLLSCAEGKNLYINNLELVSEIKRIDDGSVATNWKDAPVNWLKDKNKV